MRLLYKTLQEYQGVQLVARLEATSTVQYLVYDTCAYTHTWLACH